MADDRYVAYIGTYTRGVGSDGIFILDLDAENWSLTNRKVVPAVNPSTVLVSNNGQCLYCTTDQGVNAYRITDDGDLEFMNSQWTGGMRGCWLTTDPEDRYLFMAGYYDGRISVMHLNEDGSVGEIADGVFHEGLGMDESGHSFTPHITCVAMTPDEKGIFAVDNGLNQVKIYDFDAQTGKLSHRGELRCELDSAPRLVRVDRKKKYVYLLCEQTNHVCVYEYPENCPEDCHAEEGEILEPIQKISAIVKETDRKPASFGMDISPDGRHLFVSNTVTNTVSVFDVDPETGLLKVNCSASLSGEFPRSVAALPDNEHFVVAGLNTGTVTVYHVNYEKQYFLMSAKPLEIDRPTSVFIHKL